MYHSGQNLVHHCLWVTVVVIFVRWLLLCSPAQQYQRSIGILKSRAVWDNCVKVKFSAWICSLTPSSDTFTSSTSHYTSSAQPDSSGYCSQACSCFPSVPPSHRLVPAVCVVCVFSSWWVAVGGVLFSNTD